MIHSFRRALSCCLALMAASIAWSAEPALAIQGYDPVAYFTLERATPGDARFELLWDEHRWYFTSAHHRDLFKADPVKYAPQFTNYCAVALARGEVKAANPEYWLISDGRLYLFGKSEGPRMFRNELPASLEKARESLKRLTTEKRPAPPR
jgi:YHS domain-containing protein